MGYNSNNSQNEQKTLPQQSSLTHPKTTSIPTCSVDPKQCQQDPEHSPMPPLGHNCAFHLTQLSHCAFHAVSSTAEVQDWIEKDLANEGARLFAWSL